jgi:hypothetical protein
VTRRTAPALCQAEHSRDPQRPRPAADGLNLCHGCLTGLRRNLTDLPALHAEVEAQLPAGSSAGGPAVSGTPSPRLPVNLRAGEVLSQIAHDLAWHVHLVTDQRGLTGPAPNPAAMCAFLLRHADWLAARPEAGDVRAVFSELAGRCWGVIDPARAPLPLGPCTERLDDGGDCDGQLYATVRRPGDTSPSTLWCDTCQLELDTRQWHRFGVRYQAGRQRLSA